MILTGKFVDKMADNKKGFIINYMGYLSIFEYVSGSE